MKTLKLILLLVCVVLLVVLVLQNRTPVSVSFLWLSGTTPAVLLLFFTAAGGFVAGTLTALLIRNDRKSRPEQ